jgi:hypothetical protein
MDNQVIKVNCNLKSFLQLRSNAKAYKIFFKYFISPVTKKTNFENRLYSARTDDDLCTVSDEAFALLLLENSWDRWSDLYKKDPMSLMSRATKRGCISDVKTLYTKGGLKYRDSEGDSNPPDSNPTTQPKEGESVPSKPDTTTIQHKKGWSIEGLNRYNELFDLISKDREEHPDWFSSFMVFMEDELKPSAPEKTTTNKRTIPVMRTNLFAKKKQKVDEAQVLSSNAPLHPLADKESDDDEEEDTDAVHEI